MQRGMERSRRLGASDSEGGPLDGLAPIRFRRTALRFHDLLWKKRIFAGSGIRTRSVASRDALELEPEFLTISAAMDRKCSALRVEIAEAGGFPACSRWLRSAATTPPDLRPGTIRTPAGVPATPCVFASHHPCILPNDVSARHRKARAGRKPRSTANATQPRGLPPLHHSP